MFSARLAVKTVLQIFTIWTERDDADHPASQSLLLPELAHVYLGTMLTYANSF